jgi:hypothetical protein
VLFAKDRNRQVSLTDRLLAFRLPKTRFGIGSSTVALPAFSRVDESKSSDYFRAVKVVIEMSLLLYDRFVDQCNPASKEYALVKNGIIVQRGKDNHYERILEIYCDVEEAKGLLNLARNMFPDAVPEIEKAIAAPSDS